MRISRIVLACTLLLICRCIAVACSCTGYPAVCQSYAAAEAVFIGTVQKVEQSNSQKDEDGEEASGIQYSHIQVEKIFKGIKATELVFRSELSSCDGGFKEGQRWLLYAYYDKKNKAWEIQACDRSTQIEGAAADLLYLQGLPASAKKTYLSGELEHFEDDPVKGFTRIRGIIGAKVKIIGEQKNYEVFTDKNGIYEIYDLPPGKYAVEPEIPLGLKVRFPMYHGDVEYSDKRPGHRVAKISLGERDCGGVSFVYSSDTSISGKLIGADGQPLPNVCLNLTPTDKPAASNWVFDCTDKQGRYKLHDFPPGDYIIVVNYHGKISSDEPFPTAYYPGVFEKEKATVLTITAGAHLADYDIHIPSQSATRVIQGVLLYSDGRPVADEFVEFMADTVKEGYDGEVHTSTDAQGRYSLTVLQGLKGRLRGFMYTYSGEFLNCPQLEKIIKENGGSVPDVSTKPIKLEINTDLQDVKLIFPFPYCVKAKRE